MKYVKQSIFILSLVFLSSCTQNSTGEGYPVKTKKTPMVLVMKWQKMTLQD